MTRPNSFFALDLRGYSRLAVDATIGLTNLVEAMHYNILNSQNKIGPAPKGSTSGITGLVYQSIYGIAQLVGHSMDAVFELIPKPDKIRSGPGREAILSALNGVIGDHLNATNNPLAISMQLRYKGETLALTPTALAQAIPQLSNRIVVLLHGLCMNDLQWTREGHNHGAALARDLEYTPLYLHYNSGLHISNNGKSFSYLLENLIEQWPVEIAELVIIGHSVGGLVTRSACKYAIDAGHYWPRYLRKIFFLGTPHHGAALEQIGNQVDNFLAISPYTAPFSRLGKIRSAGITDLRHGNLLDQDWQGQDRFERSADRRQFVPLPKDVECFTIAATTGKRTGDLKDILLGDGLVMLNSALGRHEKLELDLTFPKSHQWIGYSLNHMDLLSNAKVYKQLKRWLPS
jgi:pimeloyl-ACP methyl ester carboxylesterase